MHSSLKTLLIVWIALSQTIFSSRMVIAQQQGLSASFATDAVVQLAQYQPGISYTQGGVDVEPPLIEHDVVAEADADIRQTFVATVVDDEELDNVMFFYRFEGENSFSRYEMTPVSFTSTYIAQIPTDPRSSLGIEYYIQARDTSGNRTVRGYTFSPLLRNIVTATESSPVVTEAAAQDSAVAVSEGASGKSGIPKVVYIIGGVLLLGLIAGAASSGGGGGGDAAECGAEGCRLTLNVDRPF